MRNKSPIDISPFIGTSKDYERIKNSLSNIDGVSLVTPKKEDNFFMTDSTFAKNMSKMGGYLAYAVYGTIKAYMNGRTRIASPGLKTIAGNVGCSKSQLIRAIKSLEFHNLITVNRSHRKVNSYNFPVLNLGGAVRKKLSENIIMRCPDHDSAVVKKGNVFVCPVCKIDIGKYCEDTLRHHYPDLLKKEIYAEKTEQKDAMANSYKSENDYWLAEQKRMKNYVCPVPNYVTKDIIINFL